MFAKRQLTLIILKAAAKAGAAIIVGAIIVSFFSGEIQKISKSLAEKRQLSFALEKRSEIIAALQKDISTVNFGNQTMENAFPQIDNTLIFISALEKITAENSLRQSLRFGIPAPSSFQSRLNLYEMDYNIDISGGMDSFVKYLKSFETLPYFSGISEISVGSPAGWNNDSTISMRAKLYVKAVFE